MSAVHSAAVMAHSARLTEIVASGTGSSVFYAGRQQETVGRLIWQQKHGTGGSEMVERYFASGGIHPCDGVEWVRYDDYAALLAENERMKAEVIDLCVAIADAYYETGEYKSAVDAALDIQATLIDAHKGE